VAEAEGTFADCGVASPLRRQGKDETRGGKVIMGGGKATVIGGGGVGDPMQEIQCWCRWWKKKTHLQSQNKKRKQNK
jgi:uncharacterized protein (DUF39 family)